MTINVVRLQPGEQWDQYTFELLFKNLLWYPANHYSFKIQDKFFPDDSDGIILIIPAKYHHQEMDWINGSVEKYRWVLFVLTGNEEAEFDISKLNHPNKKVYYTTPHLEKTQLELVDRFFGDGYAPQSEVLSEYTDIVMDKQIDAFFGGQITHIRREQVVEQMKNVDDRLKTDLLETAGFTQGVAPAEYYKRMANAKIIPCPSGPETPDTFRSYEALQAMALPILDTRTPHDGQATAYWQVLFGENPPIPQITDNWESLFGYSTDILEKWPYHINRAVAWWIAQKRKYAYDLIKDLDELTGQKQEGNYLNDLITVVIPCSPIPSHPSTAILDETIGTIKTHLPDCEIIITFDGIRPEQEDRRADYEKFIYQINWKCLHDETYGNVLPIIFDEHSHQVKMLRSAIMKIKTLALLYVEADCPITPDRMIDWEGIIEAIIYGKADLVRLHHEALILPDHKHLMLDDKPQDINGALMMRTQQWSQRPHVASVAYYKRVLRDYFSEDAKSFIEDKMHGVVQSEVEADGEQGWFGHRLWIYTPVGDIKRSYTTDGRAGEKKYDDTQIF